MIGVVPDANFSNHCASGSCAVEDKQVDKDYDNNTSTSDSTTDDPVSFSVR